MNRTEIHDQIDKLIQRLISNHDALKMNDGDRSLLEIEILRKLCIDLYDEINQLRLLNKLPVTQKESEFKITKKEEVESREKVSFQASEVAEPVVIEEIENAEPVSNETTPVKEIEPFETPLRDITEAEEAVETDEPETKEVSMSEYIEEPITEEVVQNLPEKLESLKFIPIVEKPIPIYSPPLKPIYEEKSVLEKVSEQQKESNSIHQSISIQKDERELLEKFLSAKIAKITNAIDISKRFELQNNLFGGDSQSYSKAILALEEAENKDKALSVYNELTLKHKWDKDNELVQELKSFIYRKY